MTSDQRNKVTARISSRRPVAKHRLAPRTALAGLLIVCGPGDKHMPDYAINWRNPLALVVCCAIVIASPCLVPCLALWIVYLRLRRTLDQRQAALYNARMRGTTA